jgi:integrase
VEIMPTVRLFPIARQTGKRWGLDWREGGKRFRRVIGSKKRAEQVRAEIEARLTRRALGLEMPRTMKPVAITDWLADYSAEYAKKNRPVTVQKTISNIRRFLSTCTATMLHEITPSDWLAFERRQLAQRSRATRNRYVAALKHFFRRAVETEHLSVSPMAHVHQMKEELPLPAYLTADDERRLFKHVEPAHKDAFQLLLLTGMRRGELVGLKPGDVDGDSLVIRQSKSRKPRTIPLTEEALALALRVVRVSFRADDLTRAYRRAALTAGLSPEKCRLHILRHTFGTRLARAGIPLNVVRELMGHATITMTARYSHPVPEHLREAIHHAGVQNVPLSPAGSRKPSRTSKRTKPRSGK